jgi:dephospho-CoA kinase
MAKVIAIGGVPATGKTSMMREIIKHHMPLTTFKYKLVRGLYNRKTNVYIIGIYDNSLFSGTDKLSMAVQPDFIKLVQMEPRGTFIFEGDRLFNRSLFQKVDCEIFVLDADEDLIHKRHIDREDTQTDQFKKSKRTKIQNILVSHKVTILTNNTKEEAQENLKTILNEIEK